MQNAELFRRGIVVPLDREAEDRLRVGDVDDSTKVRYLSISSDEMFESLWKAGLFQEINSRCGSLLDDYEEEVVETSAAREILAAIDSVASKTAAQQQDIAKFLEDARIVVEEAFVLSRPIFFVL